MYSQGYSIRTFQKCMRTWHAEQLETQLCLLTCNRAHCLNLESDCWLGVNCNLVDSALCELKRLLTRKGVCTYLRGLVAANLSPPPPPLPPQGYDSKAKRFNLVTPTARKLCIYVRTHVLLKVPSSTEFLLVPFQRKEMLGSFCTYVWNWRRSCFNEQPYVINT